MFTVNLILLYGANGIMWSKSDISGMCYPFNRAMCRIYKVKFECLDLIYAYRPKLIRLALHKRYCSAVNVLYEIVCIMRLWGSARNFSDSHFVFICIALSVCYLPSFRWIKFWNNAGHLDKRASEHLIFGGAELVLHLPPLRRDSPVLLSQYFPA